MKYDIGIGLTNRCNLNCPHCYSREEGFRDLKFEDVKSLVENMNINSINLGTGESILCNDFNDIIQYLHEKNIKMSLTTNGYTVSKISDKKLKYFNDIDFSLDFPIKEKHDEFRDIGFSKLVMEGINRCKNNGVECSIATAMMNCNYMYMNDLVNLAKANGICLRVNIYKPVRTDKFKLTYEEFWEGIRLLLENSTIVSCSEPIVNALLKNKTLDGGSPCGKKSLRIKPDKKIVPCVYLKSSDYDINEYIKDINNNISSNKLKEFENTVKEIPKYCMENCDLVEYCKGGCYSRRFYNGNTDAPDEYCFVIRNDHPKIKFKFGEKKDLVHSNYLCTIIVC